MKMVMLSPHLSCSLKPLPSYHQHHHNNIPLFNDKARTDSLFAVGPCIQRTRFSPFVANIFGGFSLNPSSVFKKCETCKGQGALECSGCKGTGKNKKNGNIFERWKCFECQGFGLKSCPQCGKGGLTPEQRGER